MAMAHMRWYLSSVFGVLDASFFLISLTIGIQYNSSMLVGDALRKFVNLFASVVQRWARVAASRATTEQYSYGFGRATTVATLFSSGVFVGLAAVLGINAVAKCIVLEHMKAPLLVMILSVLNLVSSLLKSMANTGISQLREALQQDAPQPEVVSTRPPTADVDSEASDIADARTLFLRDPTAPLEPEYGSITSHRPSRPLMPNKRLRRHGRLASLEDMSIHPASFRQSIIAASRHLDDGIQDDEEETASISSVNSDGEQSGIVHDWHGRDESQSERITIHSETHKRNIWDLGELIWAFALVAASSAIWKYPESAVEYVDPVLAILASTLALWYSVPVVQASGRILLNATPPQIGTRNLREDIESLPGIISVHHVHVWTLDGQQAIASMHVQVETRGVEEWMQLARRVRGVCHNYDIHSVTLQPEFTMAF